MYVNNGLNINGNDSLENFQGLENLTFVGGNLWIWDNNLLTSLIGLSYLDSITGLLAIGHAWGAVYGNPSLINLSGLDNLSFIGGAMSIIDNDNLYSIAGLNGLETIGGSLSIFENNTLTSLEGLNNIEPSTIASLGIVNNPILSTCDVQSVCNYLASPNGEISIHDNAPGCNSQQEVQEACDSIVSVEVLSDENTFSIYPNPATDEIFIISKNGNTIMEIYIYNQVGQRLIHENRSTDMIDVSSLKKGLYVIEVFTTESRIREKLIIR